MKKIIGAGVFLLAVFGVFMLTSFGRFQSNSDVPVGMAMAEGNYSDGTYRGTANGFRPGLTADVTIRNNLITDIQIVSHNEVGPQYWQLPIDQIPEEIIEAQNTKVDAVGGATCTSQGIMSAVEDALKQARE